MDTVTFMAAGTSGIGDFLIKSRTTAASRTPAAPPRVASVTDSEVESEDPAAREAQRTEHRHFSGAFADRHGHGVGRDDEDGEYHRTADPENEGLDVAEGRAEV